MLRLLNSIPPSVHIKRLATFAAEFLIPTPDRTNEVTGGKREEFNLKKAV
jgi:hypothetical protein